MTPIAGWPLLPGNHPRRADLTILFKPERTLNAPLLPALPHRAGYCHTSAATFCRGARGALAIFYFISDV